MLFDLRGRGRRRTVQAIYLGLAVLIGVGLVGFGVGAGVGGGGVLSSLTGGEGGSNAASFSAQINKYKKLIEKQPNNVYAWEQLTLNQLHEAGGEKYTTNAGLTSKGKELFNQIAQSWNSYIALNPHKPNPELAQEVVRVFGEEGLNQPAEAVKVMQIVIAGKHGSTPQYMATLYSELAEYAYKAHNTGTGDLAAEKAVELAPSSEKKRLQQELAEVKKYPNGREYTATENGKAIKVKPGPNGTFTGTTTAPATTTPGGLSNSSK
jgi:hypothetical protein